MKTADNIHYLSNANDNPPENYMKADCDDGYTRIANSFLDAIITAELSGREMKILLALIRKTYGFHKKTDQITGAQIAKLINYDGDVCNIRRDIAELKRRKFIQVDGEKIGPNPIISEWILTKNKPRKVSVKNNTECQKQHSESVKNNTVMSVKNNTQQKINININKNIKLPDGNPVSPPPSPQIEKIPFDQILALYHEILPMCPAVKKLTEKRKKQIRGRWLSGDIANLDEWRDYFEFVKKSKFLTGNATPAPGRKIFICDLEWLTNESNFVKIWERRYHE